MPTNAQSRLTRPTVCAAVVRRRALGARTTAALAVLLALATMLLGAAVLTVATGGSAVAHDRLEASDPPADAELSAPPGQIVLTYSGTIIDTGTQVVVTTPAGEVPADVVIDGPEVTAMLPTDLPGGDYEVAWRVVSADGHPIEGTFGFTVAAQPTPAPTGTEDTESGEEPAATDTASEPVTEPTDAAAGGAGDDDSGMPLLFGAALLVIVALASAAIWRTRARLHRGYGPPGQD